MKRAISLRTDAFCRDLAAIAARYIVQVRPEERKHAMAILQDSCSLFAPYTADHIATRVKHLERRANRGPPRKPPLVY